MIRIRLLISFILVGLLPILGVGIGTYIVNYQNGLQQTFDRLESVSARKELSLKGWFQSLTQDLQIAAQTNYSPNLVINALKLSDEGISYTWYNNLVRKKLRNFVIQSDGLMELFLINLSGEEILSTNPDFNPVDSIKIDGLNEELSKTIFRIIINDHINENSNNISDATTNNSYLLVLLQVNSEDGSKVGWIGGKFKLSPLEAILSEQTSMGETGIAYLVSWDHSLLSTIKINNKIGQENRDLYINNDGINKTIQNGTTTKGIYKNFASESVVGIYRWIPEINAVLCVEQNIQEAFSAVSTNIKINLLIAFCALIFAIVVGLSMTQSIANPIVKLANTATKISKGDLNQIAKVTRNDEIGSLAVAFNIMTAQLRELINSLELRVDERTADLRKINNELNQRVIQLETSAKVARDITSILNIDLLLKRVVELIQESFGYYHVQVYLLEENKTLLRLRASSGNRKIQQNQIRIDTKSVNVQAIKTGEIQLVNNIHQNPYFLFDESLPETKSELVIPLKVGREIIGTLDIHGMQIDNFQEKDLLVLQSLGDQIAIAIENARLYNQARDLAVLEERHRLARELHDSATQSLYSLVLLAEGWRRKLINNGNGEMDSYLLQISHIATQALKEMRLLILELSPPILEQEGFVGAIQKRLDTVEKRVGISARVVMDEFCEIPLFLEKDLYWIAQEALNNSLRHAKASHVSVEILFEEESLILKVSDDGIGFDTNQIENRGGLGLINMEERAKRMGGRLIIQSSKGEGTIVMVYVPLPERIIDKFKD